MLTAILFLIVGCVGCVSYGTFFLPSQKHTTFVGISPCEALMVMKIPENEIDNYELIGVCKSTMSAGGMTGKKNKAIEEIKKCACDHGGTLIKLIKTNEVSGVAGTGLVDQFNPNATKVIYHDTIEAEIFKKKERIDG
jgi:hypothetical protein